MPNNPQNSEFTLVEQAMGNPPGWLTYWGITVVAIFLSIVLGITSIIRYPDVLQAQAVTYIDRPPVEVFSTKTATINALLIQENDTVLYNAPLVVLESSSNWKVVLTLDSLLETSNTLINSNIPIKGLGSLNPLYQEIALLEKQIKDANRTDITSKRVATIQKEIEQNQILNASLLKQKNVFEKELNNIQKDLERSKQLLQDGVISQQTFEQTENTYLQNERALHQMESTLISNKIKIQQLQLQIPESKKQQHDLFFRLETDWLKKKELLKTAIEKWKKEHIIYAPIAGTIVLNNNIQEGTQIAQTLPVLTIIPVITHKKSFLKAQMEAAGIGKIEIGQKATVYFDNYPSAEFGTLTAEVFKIAPIPNQNQYEVLLKLPQDWTTNYGIAIPKQAQMSANIAIQTKEYTLLERVFSGLLDVLEN